MTFDEETPGGGAQDPVGKSSTADGSDASEVIGGVTLLDRYGAVLGLDRNAGLAYGYRSDEVVGTHFSRLFPEEDIRQGKPRQMLKDAEAAGTSREEGWLVKKSGERFRTIIAVTALRDAQGEIAGFVMDVTGPEPARHPEAPAPPARPDVEEALLEDEQLERINHFYAMLSKVNEAIVRVRDPKELYSTVCRVLVEEGRYKLAWIGLLDADTQIIKPVASYGVEQDYLAPLKVSALEIPEGMGPSGTAVRSGRHDICQDLAADPRIAPWRKSAEEQGVRSMASFPLISEGQVAGVIGICSDETGFFDEEQVRLLDSLADNVAFAGEAIVREIKRLEAEESQLASEQYYRSLIENNLDIIAIIDSEGKIGYTSPSVERVLGYKRSEVRDRPIFEFLPESEVPRAMSVLEEVLSNRGQTREIEVPLRHKNGTFRTLEVAGKAFEDSSGSIGVMLNARDETERKLVEEKVRASEETQGALINAISESAFLMDTTGVILAANQTGAKRLGLTVEEMIGRNVNEFMPPEIGRSRKESMDEAVRTGKPVSAEDERDGTLFEYVMYPVLGRMGEVERLAVIARDITASRLSEEAQRKDRDFISAVINTTGALVVVLDSEGRVILFNSTCEHTTGYSFDDVRGRPIWETLLVQEEITQFKQYFETLRSEGFQSAFESHWLTRHGAMRLIEWSNTVLYEENGAVGYVISTGLDITERRKAEEDLKQSEEQYRTMFESTGTAMCIAADDALVSFMNQEFERMTGFSADEVEGKRAFTEFLDPGEVESFMNYHREIRRVRRNVPIHFECKVRDKRGNTLNVLANMGLIPGRGVSVISLIDITRERSYEHDLQETAERLRHFLTVASHELRHPITIVKGYANTLTEYMQQMPEDLIQEILSDIDNSTDRLTRYVDELMDVSRVEEGRFPVEKQAVETENLVGMALDDMKMLGASNQFSVQIAEDAVPVDVDPEKFVQLLVIILENAVKFSPDGSPVEIEVARDDGNLVVSVMDRGPGIPEKDRELVFDRFYQVEDALHHSTPGIGLGLYIAREIATGHGGSIWCEAREGGGSVFRFSVPLA